MAEARLALCKRQQVHHGDVLGVLAERRHQWGIAEHRPYILHFLEQLYGEFLKRHFGLARFFQCHIDGSVNSFQVAHHASHHTARQAAANQQRGAYAVARVDVESEEVIDELLGKLACLHIGFHIDVFHQESCIFQHRLNRDDIGMDHAPRQWLHGTVDNVGTGFGHFEGRSHRESGTRVTVVLHFDVRIFLLHLIDEFAERSRTADACHVFQGNFVSSELDQLIDDGHVIFNSVYRRVGNRKGCLRYHSGLFGIFHREFEIAGVVQSAEGTHDIYTLCFLNLAHQLADIFRHAVHTQSVEGTLEHVGLYSGLVELFGPGPYCLVGIFAIHKVYLLEGASIGLDAVKTAHGNNNRGDPYQLVDTWLIFSRRLPHITVNKAKLYFSCHKILPFFISIILIHNWSHKIMRLLFR